MNMFCEKCGAKLKPDVKFCGGCGSACSTPTSTRPIKDNPIPVIGPPARMEPQVAGFISWILVGAGILGVLIALMLQSPDRDDSDTNETQTFELEP